MGFKGISQLIDVKKNTANFAAVVRTMGIRRVAIDSSYLAYFVEEVMMYCENADTIADVIECELVRAQAVTAKFDEKSVPLTKKEKKNQKQIDTIL